MIIVQYLWSELFFKSFFSDPDGQPGLAITELDKLSYSEEVWAKAESGWGGNSQVRLIIGDETEANLPKWFIYLFHYILDLGFFSRGICVYIYIYLQQPYMLRVLLTYQDKANCNKNSRP